MSIQIESYQPVEKNAKCKRCNSATVTWHDAKPSEPNSTKGKWLLLEIFDLADEEVASSLDTHARYCTNPIRPVVEDGTPQSRKSARQAELAAAEADFMDEGDAPEKKPKRSPEKGEIQTDGHPYCCSSCGAGIIDGLDGLMYDFMNDTAIQLHTCDGKPLDTVASGRKEGVKAAREVRFIDISERMEKVLEIMEAGNRDPNQSLAQKRLMASYGAEYLVLRKRLYTEIPS